MELKVCTCYPPDTLRRGADDGGPRDFLGVHAIHCGGMLWNGKRWLRYGADLSTPSGIVRFYGKHGVLEVKRGAKFQCGAPSWHRVAVYGTRAK